MKKILLLLIPIFSLVILHSSALKAEPKTVYPATLKIGIIVEPKTLNPFSATDRWSKNIIKQLYQPLYIKAPKTLDIIPWLAKNKASYDNKKKEVLIHLKQAFWDDGTRFSSEDVVFTVNIIKEFQIPSFYSDWNFVEEVKAIDNETVKFKLAEQRAIFFSQALLTPIIQKKEWVPLVTKARASKNPLKTLLESRPEKASSSGPFRFHEWQPGKKLTLTRSETFFGQEMEINGYKLGPYIDAVSFLIYKDTDQMIDALNKGEIDYIWGGIEPEQIKNIKENLKIYFVTSPINAIQYLSFNLRRKPFHDRSFRQALAYLINKNVIVENVFNNYAVRLDSMIPPGNTKWHNSKTKKYGMNLSRKERIKKAEEILQSAGYRWKEKPGTEYGKVLLMPDGQPVRPITILIPSFGYDALRAISAKFIQEWWKEIGLSVEIRFLAFKKLMKGVKTDHDFDAVVLGWNLGIDPDYFRVFFHSREAVSYGKNFSGYKNRHFDSLAEASAIETDFNKRKKLIIKMEQVLMEDVPYIPLYTPFIIDAYRLDRFHGWLNQLDGIGNIWSLLLIKSMSGI
jgi:peptide/nickel transport system substrate-binding protein